MSALRPADVEGLSPGQQRWKALTPNMAVVLAWLHVWGEEEEEEKGSSSSESMLCRGVGGNSREKAKVLP